MLRRSPRDSGLSRVRAVSGAIGTVRSVEVRRTPSERGDARTITRPRRTPPRNRFATCCGSRGEILNSTYFTIEPTTAGDGPRPPRDHRTLTCHLVVLSGERSAIARGHISARSSKPIIRGRALNRFPERLASLGFALVALVAMLAAPQVARAQGLFERLNLDKLKLTAMGGSYGAIRPSQMEATQAYSLHADYGEIAPRWRVVFTATYWGSRYTDDAVRGFADSLARSVDDPDGNELLFPHPD